MSDGRILDILAKHGVVLCDERHCGSHDYWEMLRETLNDQYHKIPLSKVPPKSWVRITILIEPIENVEASE